MKDPGSSEDPKAVIRARALELGFDAVGFARSDLGAAPRQALAAFLAAGRHGDMGWLAAHADRRGDPRTLWPETGSIIVLGMSYAPGHDPTTILQRPDRGAVSVYAQGRDYHDVVKRRLKELARWMVGRFGGDVKVFTDTAPVMEKPLAAAAGLGWQGKHSNLVSRDFGSWLFLGEVFTTLDLASDPAGPDRCGSCRACLASCPTDAFPAPYQLDARRCISYLTIEHKGHIPLEFRIAMGNRIYGCDDCLAACPWNKFARRTPHDAFAPRAELTAPRLADLAELDDAGFREVFSGSPIKRIGRDRFVRNVLIALGNSGDTAQVPTAIRRLDDASPLVRAMAVWAIARLLPEEAFRGLREERSAREPDEAVHREWLQPGIQTVPRPSSA